MGNSMPLSLIASWVVFFVFFGFVNTHQRHARHFRGESQGYLRALQASVLLGSLAAWSALASWAITSRRLRGICPSHCLQLAAW